MSSTSHSPPWLRRGMALLKRVAHTLLHHSFPAYTCKQAAYPKSLSRTIEFSFNRHSGGSMRLSQIVFALLLTALVTQAQTDWAQYGSDEAGSRYSAAAQIN